jgi:hypothetical protein
MIGARAADHEVSRDISPITVCMDTEFQHDQVTLAKPALRGMIRHGVCHRRSIWTRCDLRLDGLEPALDPADQPVVFEALVVRRVGLTREMQPARARRESPVTPAAIAMAVGQVHVEGEVVPARRERCPIGQSRGSPELGAHLASYRAAWREAGHAGPGDVCLRLPVYAAPTERASLEEPRENIMYFFQRHTELTRARLGRAGAGPTGRVQSRLDELAELSYERILETRVAFGTAASLIARLGRLREDLGLDGVLGGRERRPGEPEEDLCVLALDSRRIDPTALALGRSE